VSSWLSQYPTSGYAGKLINECTAITQPRSPDGQSSSVTSFAVVADHDAVVLSEPGSYVGRADWHVGAAEEPEDPGKDRQGAIAGDVAGEVAFVPGGGAAAIESIDQIAVIAPCNRRRPATL
jgi:hypothetical protein